jgi:hypothetical protein
MAPKEAYRPTYNITNTQGGNFSRDTKLDMRVLLFQLGAPILGLWLTGTASLRGISASSPDRGYLLPLTSTSLHYSPPFHQ